MIEAGGDVAIFPSDLDVDESLARRVLGYARPVAPCLQKLEGDDRETAIAILQSVALRVQTSVAGVRAIGDWSFFSDTEMGGYFGVDDRAALRSLCGSPVTGGRGPAFSFPPPDDALRRVWRRRGA